MRRNIVRYAILAYVITLQRVSLRVKRRFPSWQHVVDSGLMLESERKVFEKMDGKSPMSKYWMPLVWATNIINRARKEGLITSDHIVQTLLVELSDIRRRLGALIGYDTVCVPLVYTQVVTLSLYTYFVAALMGRQLVPPAPGSTSKYEPDVYFPLFTALQFCFYVGWLKVAEVLINPFGEDDDDIELNWLIDRHIKAAYMIVDEMHEEHPELLKDQYWEEVVPKDLPYTVASEHYRRHEPSCSADHYKVKTEDAVYANVQAPRKSHDETYADYESVDTPLVERRKNWFQRQISRMGSVRSASTAYSSGGFFGRNRLNSVVYSSPEAGQPISPPNSHHKMSLYERLVGRKSGRGQHRQNSKHGQKSNGSVVPTPTRNRPRIPTPESKEVAERDGRLAMGMQSMGVFMAQQGYQSEVPVLGAIVLSPIEETDGGSVNTTLHAGQPGTTALAQAVLAPALAQGGSLSLPGGMVSPVTLPVSQITLLRSSAPSSPRSQAARATVTELSDRDSEASGPGTPPERTRASSYKRGEVYV
ncbi:bestrophin-2 isoform X2 [Bicyclus anynana]|nr:bestrophin-2 isoform X2 [Bicyclus anynana]